MECPHITLSPTRLRVHDRGSNSEDIARGLHGQEEMQEGIANSGAHCLASPWRLEGRAYIEGCHQPNSVATLHAEGACFKLSLW